MQYIDTRGDGTFSLKTSIRSQIENFYSSFSLKKSVIVTQEWTDSAEKSPQLNGIGNLWEIEKWLHPVIKAN